MALGALRAARDVGLVVGQDLSLVAHDDGIEAIRPETLSPPLTTTFSSIRAAGSRVAELALALVAGEPAEALAEVWPVELVYRNSTRPPLTGRCRS